MYIGRIVAVSLNHDNKFTILYRVSSRSFANRQAVANSTGIAIVPKEGFEQDIYKNPYISYTCLRFNEQYAVIANGTHTDHIFEKMQIMPMKHALADVLLAMDYEHDDYNTPRIVSAVDKINRKAFLASIRKDALVIKEIDLTPGSLHYVATYEHNGICARQKETNVNFSSANDACKHIMEEGIFANFTNKVLAVSAHENNTTFETAINQ